MGRSLERRRLEFLDDLTVARHILILGEGDGRFLQKLLEVNPSAHIDCVDSSGRMLEVARARAAAGRGAANAAVARVRFHHADARLWLPPADRRYDLVVTHFFLDCFSEEELHPLLERLAAATTLDAQWVVSEFRLPERGWQAWRARLWIGGLYRLFGWTTGLRVRRLPLYRPLLERVGFRLARQVTVSAGLLVSERWTRSTRSHHLPTEGEQRSE